MNLTCEEYNARGEFEGFIPLNKDVTLGECFQQCAEHYHHRVEFYLPNVILIVKMVDDGNYLIYKVEQ